MKDRKTPRAGSAKPMMKWLLAGLLPAACLLPAANAQAELVQQPLTLSIAPLQNAHQPAPMRTLSVVEPRVQGDGHRLIFADGGEVELLGTEGLSAAHVGDFYAALSARLTDPNERANAEQAIEVGDHSYMLQVAQEAQIFNPPFDLDLLDVSKSMHRLGFDGYIEVPMQLDIDQLADAHAWNAFARQAAIDSMVGGWWTVDKLPNYIEDVSYVNDSEGWVIETITIRQYDIDGGPDSGDIYRNGVKVGDLDKDNNGYRDGTLADRLAKWWKGKKKNNNNSGGGSGDDTDGLIIMMPHFISWLRYDTAPHYDRAMLSDLVVTRLYEAGAIDAMRAHITAQHNLGMSPDPAALQQILDQAFVPTSFSFYAVDNYALGLTVLQQP